MTHVGAGGVVLSSWVKSKRFHKEYGRMTISMRDRVDECLQALLRNPVPAGLRFEKLKGYSRPDIYTIHVTGNYKISMEIQGNRAFLRNVAPHDEIDLAP